MISNPLDLVSRIAMHRLLSAQRLSRGLCAALLIGMLTTAVGPAPSAEGKPPLWKQLMPRKRVEADPAGDYTLGQHHGPWLIMATSFEAEEGEREARELVLDLRQNHNLAAFYYAMTFQLEDSRPGRGLDAYGGPIKRKYRRGSEVLQHAVLVGEFPSIDDIDAQELLDQVKILQPESLQLGEGDSTAQSLAGVRQLYAKLKQGAGQQVVKGPLGHAFLTRNPLLPKEFFNPGGVEPEVAEWNSGLDFSLLKCPGTYSIKVATFRGRTLLKEAQTAEGRNSKVRQADENDPLVLAGKNAHELTVALRSRGWEAYEMHDRHESYVTIGSFDEGRELPDGRIHVDHRDAQAIVATFGAMTPENIFDRPALQDQMLEEQTKQKFKSVFTQGYGQVAEGFHPKRFVGIPFDIHPVAVKVPKQSVSASFARKY
jgi:hypothetical protein